MGRLSEFFAAWELFADAVVAAMAAGAMLGALGVFVVLYRMIFVSVALSQVASLGVAATFWLRARVVHGTPLFLQEAFLLILHPSLGATASTVLVSLGIMRPSAAAEKETVGARLDGALGWIFVLGAAGTLIIATHITQDVHDIQSLLFGSAVAVLPSQRHLLVCVALGILAFATFLFAPLVESCLDPDGAGVRGVPVQALSAITMGLIAVALSLSTRVLGALPVLAFSMVPALAALQLMQSLFAAFIVAAVFGASAGFLGYLVAFVMAWPVGASQALISLLPLFASMRLSGLRHRTHVQRKGRWRR